MTASRGASSSVKRRPEASSSVAPSPRTASVISSPSWGVPGRARAVGWNWQNSRSARSAPAAAPRTGPAPIAPQGLVVRRQRAAAPPVASTVAAEAIGPRSVTTPRQRSAVAPERQGRGALAGLDPRLGVDHRRQLRGDLVAGLAAARVDDAAARMPRPRGPSASSSLVVEVEDDAPRSAARGRRRGPLRPAPGPRRGGRGRARRRSCRPRGGRASRPARGRRPGPPAPSSWRSAREGCGRSGRPGRRPPPPATPSTGRPRRRRRRRRRTPARAPIARPPLGGWS